MATSHLINIHPLLFEPGDRLSREEFLELWEQMPDLKKAELIDGVAYMPSPVSLPHSRFDGQCHTLLGYYAARTQGCKFVANATWLMLESAPQPDAALYILPGHGGRVGVREDFAAGAPELVVEVSRSSRSYDLGPKLALYQRAGVLEYAGALVKEERIEWRILVEGSYRLMEPDAKGVFQSNVFPGLWVDSAAFWREDGAGLLATLDEGLRSDEHARFVEALQRQSVSEPGGSGR
jgi:Uma2 family endonuclease